MDACRLVVQAAAEVVRSGGDFRDIWPRVPVDRSDLGWLREYVWDVRLRGFLPDSFDN
jgi:hypothetical protein